MKSLLGSVGLGLLVCVPCLAVIAGVSLAAFGGGLIAFATNPATQAAGLLLLLAALALGAWHGRRRRACPTCGVREAGHQSHAAAEQQTPLP